MTNERLSVHSIQSHVVLSELLKGATELGHTDPVAVLRCALHCAEIGGQMIMDSLGRRTTSAAVTCDTKVSDADLVTETDIAVETFIRQQVSSTFPSHLFVGEEGTGANAGAGSRDGQFVWIVDPIDGTTNFVHRFPIVCVSIGIAFGDDLVGGVVFNPTTDELWFAWKGCGAYMKTSAGCLNRIKTSGCSQLTSALVSTGFSVPVLKRKSTNTEARSGLIAIHDHNIKVLMTQSRDIRRIGSAACDICYVAMGRTDCYFEFGVREWDIAAGLVILSEAGGAVSTVCGKEPFSVRGRNVLVASSAALQHELNAVLVDKDAVMCIEQLES